MALKTVEIKKIKVGERFRKNLKNIDQLIESIKEKGVVQPITLNKNLELMAGGRRLHAATEAGLDKIPALIRDTSDELDLREVELIENVFRDDLEWHEEAQLVKRINDLQEEKGGRGSKGRTAEILDKSNSWVTRKLQMASALEAMPELKVISAEDKAVKFLKNQEEKIVVNELRRRQEKHISEVHEDNFLRIASANYIVGDVFEGFESFIELRKEMPRAAQFDLIEVDPPYAIDLNAIKKGEASDELERYTEISVENYPDFLLKLSRNLFDSCAPNAWVIFWYGPTWHTAVFATLRAAGFTVDDIPAIWDKGSGQTNQPELYLARCYEPFAICRKGNPSIRKRGRSNVFRYSPVTSTDKYHPTQRPIELMREVISTFAMPNMKVLVPFLGSGVTLRACYLEGLLGTGWDLDENNRNRFLLQVEEDISNGLYGKSESEGDRI